MIYTDLPIQNVGDDELNRVAFAKNLGNLINNYKGNECLVLGLIGKWGSGKTSLINLTLNELDKNIIIKFDPWLFSEQKNLILNFFNELTCGLKSTKQNNGFEWKAVSDNLQKLVKYIKPDEVSLNINPLNLGGVNAVYHTGSDERSDGSLEDLKSKINSHLEKLDHRIIVVIDNIDRLNRSEVKEIFQLVKSLADFKNIIYILSFDKEVVLKSLKDYVFSPEVFLEKIIQISIDVPKIEKYKLQEYFQKKLRELLDTKEVFSNEIIGKVSYNLSFFVENIRDVKRYLNNLSFYLDVIKSEVNIEDYLLITALQIFENPIYLDIKSNQELFVDNYNINHDKEEIEKDIEEIIKKKEKVDENIIRRILCKLFPKINHVYNNIYDNDYSGWEKDLKIASAKFFDRYFTLNIPENEISTVEFNHIINSKDYKSLENNILKIDQPEKIIDLLRRLNIECLDIPKEKIPMFIEFLFKKGDTLRTSNNRFNSYKDYLTLDLLKELIHRSEHPRFNIIKENTLKKGTSLFIPIWFLDGGGKDYLNEEQLKQMEKIILDKIHDCNKRGELLSCYHLNVILNYWSSIENKEVVKEFIKGVFKDENKTIKLINGFITEVEHVKLNIEDVFGNNSKLSPNYTERWSSITFDLITMKTLISLEYVIEQLNKKQYSTEHKELIEELKRQIEDDLKM